MRGHPVAGIGLVLAGICSVQLGAALAKVLFGVVDPTAMVWLRLVIAAIILLAVARPKVSSWNRSTWTRVAVFGVVLGCMNLTYYMSLSTVPLAVAVTCELLGPLVLAFVLSRRGLDVLWVLLALAGIGIVGWRAFQGALDPVGVIFGLIAGACWAGYILASRSVGAVVPGIGGLAVAMAIGAVVATPFGAVSAVSTISADPRILAPVAGVAILSSVLAYGFELAALRRVAARVFGVLMALEPAAAALFGFLLAGELVHGMEWIAIVLVVAASGGAAVTASRTRLDNTAAVPIP